ncbi:MAG: RsmB/NOP family class I SAM-dependent RNA methyltransferase [Lachnospiraceae bacterium]|nr:RsmB/NOP family class I SAM-dependent RNA methyltransferase [Lachnospiraceae bacterium]
MDPNLLPQAFKDHIRDLLAEEYKDYEESLDAAPCAGIRLNLIKCRKSDMESFADVAGAPVSWCGEGFYAAEGAAPSEQPAYFAGLYYIQEPSAMSPAAYLPVRPGARVLDLCAAPGGKSTQLAGKMTGGVLYANDISPSRGKALLKNLERAGAKDIFVTAETPERLERSFPGYFDSVLVDAPCSGEGMVRKDPSILKDWMERGPQYYSVIQKEILESAAGMTAGGGSLLYSTCTFSEAEDEKIISDFLEKHSDFTLVPLHPAGGAVSGKLPGTLKFWPHRVRGEGHFLALMKKRGEAEERALTEEYPVKIQGLDGITVRTRGAGKIFQKDSLRYLLPGNEKVIPGLRYLRTGLLLGEDKGKRFVPSQALAMALRAEDAEYTLRLHADDSRLKRYLKGESVDSTGAEAVPEGARILILYEKWPLGFAKKNRGLLKNELNPGWRIM